MTHVHSTIQFTSHNRFEILKGQCKLATEKKKKECEPAGEGTEV